jgi:glycosyltransferase involved in cell wall biosynthesis
MPKVSVIVPNYNHARYLRERLDSVFAQTFRDFEVIVLDDASTDDSIEVIRPYLELPDVRFVANERNTACPFAQWEKGVKLAQGRYIWLAESDDVADPYMLERLVPMLEVDPRVGIAYCQSERIDGNGNPLGTMHWWTDDLDPLRWRDAYSNDGDREVADYLIWRNTIPNASAVVFRRAAYEDVGDDPLSFRLCGDWLVWVSMLRHYKIAYWPEPLNYFRVHGQSVRESIREVRMLEEIARVQAVILKRFPLCDATRSSIVLGKVHELIRRYRAARGSGSRIRLREVVPYLPIIASHPLTAARAYRNRPAI